jgi:predicted dehydrogenase
MAIRVAIIGYGAVGSIHAAKLARARDVELAAVYGPQRDKASAFALAHGIKHVSDTLADAVSHADVAIICSPSAAHYHQALQCLERRIHTLVELPPCEDADEAAELQELAHRRGVKLGCAHTSRFVVPFALLKKSIEGGALGQIQEVNYVRYHKLRDRSWTDNALLHHAAHPIDLLLYWCGDIVPKGCVAVPDVRLPHTVSVLGKLPSGGAATITVTYVSRLYQMRMMVVGENHSVETDGFSYMKSDFPELQFQGNDREIYEDAIRAQDVAFLAACRDNEKFVSWEETLKLLRAIDQFRKLGASYSRSQ